MRPVLFYGEVLRFFKTSQSFDQITTLTYILMENFLSLFLYSVKKVLSLHANNFRSSKESDNSKIKIVLIMQGPVY